MGSISGYTLLTSGTNMSSIALPIEFTDPINANILEVSEDQIQGFQRDPLGEISRLSGVELPVVIERIQAMLRAGNIRRVRQTLLATNLAQGALVAWQIPEAKLNAAFDWMFQKDLFSGHVVTRSTDVATQDSFETIEFAAPDRMSACKRVPFVVPSLTHGSRPKAVDVAEK